MRLYKNDWGNFLNEETHNYNGLYVGDRYKCYYGEPLSNEEDEIDVRKEIWDSTIRSNLYWL